MRIDHIGIATDDLEGLSDLFGTLLDAPVVHEETIDGLHVAFLDAGSGYLELLEPVDEEGAIPRYLADRGPGLHHVAFEVEDAAAALSRAHDLGIDPVDEEPRPGAWGHDVAFLHPRSTGGVLVEFVEH